MTVLNVHSVDDGPELVLAGGDVLLEDEFSHKESVAVGGGRIQSVGCSQEGRGVFDATGLLVLPGAVDIHGDAFERQLMPRPGVHFPHTLALLDTDRQMLASGITTAYHGLTWSWEPGLRGKQAAHAFMEALKTVRDGLGCDTRLHLRFETHNLDDLEEVEACLRSGQVDLLAFNDHIGHLTREVQQTRKAESLAGRSGLSVDEYRSRLEAAAARAGEVPQALARLSRAARGLIPMASHDDDTPEIRAWYRGLGCRVAEFPTSPEAAKAAKEHGDHVVMGAPNVLRGMSHASSRMDGRQSVADGLCDVLASDYYYPALPEAPFVLDREGLMPLARAWKLVSENPAKAAGLADRGRIAPGLRADLTLIDPQAIRPRVVAVVAAGRLVHAGPDAFPRMAGLGTARAKHPCQAGPTSLAGGTTVRG